MKKMSLTLVLYSTFTLLSFTACSPGYGCFYSASETMFEPEQMENATEIVVADRPNILSEEINCLP